MDNYKTIKELADELNISKQAVRKYFDKMPTKLIPTKVDGRYLINKESSDYIRLKVLRNDVALNLVDSTINQPIDTEVDSGLIDKLTNKLLKEKEDRISFLEIQNENLNKLLDQQQQLTLQSNKQIEQLQKQLLIATTEEKEEEQQKFQEIIDDKKEESTLKEQDENSAVEKKRWFQFWK